MHEREPYLRAVFESMPFSYPVRIGDYPDSLFEPVEQTAVVLDRMFEAAKRNMRENDGELPLFVYLFCRRHPVSEEPAGRGLYMMRWVDADRFEPPYRDAIAMLASGLAFGGNARAICFMTNVWLATLTKEEHEAPDRPPPSKHPKRKEATMLMYESRTTKPVSFTCSVNRFGRRGIVLGNLEQLGGVAGVVVDSRFVGILPENRDV